MTDPYATVAAETSSLFGTKLGTTAAAIWLGSDLVSPRSQILSGPAHTPSFQHTS